MEERLVYASVGQSDKGVEGGRSGSEDDDEGYEDFLDETNENDEEGHFMRTRTFPRTLTDPLAHVIDYITDTDGEWTRQMLEEYGKIDDKGHDGDVPEQPAFATDIIFWKMLLIGFVLGSFIGLVALVFMNIIDEVPLKWTQSHSFDDPEDGKFYQGKKYWIAVTTGTGFAVGFIRWLLKYPENLPGFFKEVNTCHVDPTWALPTAAISAISLAGGANLGPEQAMGNLGGGLATIICDYFHFEDHETKNLIVLTGMSGAMGALFPTPLLGVLMIHELGNPPKGFMESTLLMSVSAIMAFIVFYQLEEKTWLERLTPNYTLSALWEFDLWHCSTAVVIGLVASGCSLGILLSIGIVKQILFRIQERCDKTMILNGQIVISTLGGLVIGLINYALPLTVGNGHQSSTSIIKNFEVYSTHLLLCTAFARVFTLAVSMNCGFIGGFVFPLLSLGIIAGVIAHQQYDNLPLGLTIGCFLAAMPAGICPMPFTLVGISCFMLYFGLQQTVPIFISCVTAYLMFTGIGVMGLLQQRAQEAEKAKRKKKKKGVNDFEGYKHKAGRFS